MRELCVLGETSGQLVLLTSPRQGFDCARKRRFLRVAST
jgi:hypothetical protein